MKLLSSLSANRIHVLDAERLISWCSYYLLAQDWSQPEGMSERILWSLHEASFIVSLQLCGFARPVEESL